MCPLSSNTKVIHQHIRWEISRDTRDEIFDLLPPEAQNCYPAMVLGMKERICGYINAHNQCDGKTKGVSVLEGCDGGGKVMKVRCAVPGRGASRSLRVIMAIFCDGKRVLVTGADWRKDL